MDLLARLPSSVLVDCILVPHCSGRDICALALTSKSWWDALELESALWERLYKDERSIGFSRVPPRFPTCGSWRDVYLRSVRLTRLVIVKTLTRPNQEMRLVLPRLTPLFGLKREIRAAQLALDGLQMEDFDLVDVQENVRLGVAGNDSLPPAEDIRKLLFLGFNRRHDQAARAARKRDMGWRANLSLLGDGILLEQVLPSQDGQGGGSNNTIDFESAGADPLQLDRLLDECFERGGGPTSFKTSWRHAALHPLLQTPFSPLNLALFAKQYMKSIFRVRFFLDVFVLRALLTSGFCLSFYRLCALLFPMVWTSQIKQVFRITNIFFLLAFVRDVARVTSKALLPVMESSLRVELWRAALRLVFTWETKYEGVIVNGAEVVREMALHLRGRPYERRWDLESIARAMYASPSLMYALSSALYSGFTSVTEPSLWVSLPLYLYSLPIVYCLVVLRVRVFLAQSYVSLLLA